MGALPIIGSSAPVVRAPFREAPCRIPMLLRSGPRGAGAIELRRGPLRQRWSAHGVARTRHPGRAAD